MKKIAVFFKLPGVLDYPLSQEDYFQCYLELTQAVRAVGADFFIVRGQETYLGSGKFAHSWCYQGRQIVESGEVTVDLVFDKGGFISDGYVKVFNGPFVNNVCTNKWLTYNLFKEFCPQTWLVQDKAGLSVLKEVTTELAVVKPIDGEEGNGVFIDQKNALLKHDYSYPVLAQEFLDSSKGIPGVMTGLHDLRIAVIDGEIVYSYYRTPPQESYLANEAQGGSLKEVDLNKIPRSVVDIIQKVDQVMSVEKHRYYSVDFAMTDAGPKIIELNSRLGSVPEAQFPFFVSINRKLANVFVAMSQE